MKKREPLLLLLGIGMIGLGLFLAKKSAETNSAPEMAPVAQAPSTRAPATPQALRPLNKAEQDSLWSKFQDRFGPGLQPEFSSQGRLIAIHGNPGSGRPAGPGFLTTDPQKAIARAKEIIDGARELLGIKESLPLENPTAHGSSVSAQVTFRETHTGVELSPAGDVSVDLGPQGELLGLGSNYLSNISVDNSSSLSVGEAKVAALAAFEGQDSVPTVQGGSQVVWVTEEAQAYSGLWNARYAYAFNAGGRQVVVDAQTGKVILSRDRRQF